MKVQVYEWLKGAENAYIEVPRPTVAELMYDVSEVSGFSWIFNSRKYPNATHSEYQFTLYKDELGGENANLTALGHAYSDLPLSGIVTISEGKLHYDSKEVKIEDDSFLIDKWSLFNARNETGARKALAQISYFKSDTLHLVPCLTSDNEACMVDLLTGDLYRNQGSGAFSVEGECLYEFETPIVKQVMRKPNVVVRLREWLRGDGDSWIDTGYIPLSSDEYKAHAINSGYVSSSAYNAVYGRLYRTGGDNQVTLLIGSSNYWRAANFGPANQNMTNDTEILFSLKNSLCVINNMEYNVEHNNVEYAQGSLFLFARNRDGIANDIFNGKIIYFEVVGKLYLHPCDILYHPTLPPQSAMIDPSTGTIYTNQGTGNFTCEGADLGIWTDTLYEDMRIKDTKADMVCVMNNGEPRVVWERTQPFMLHKWLVGDGGLIDAGLYQHQSIKLHCKPINSGDSAQRILCIEHESHNLSILFDTAYDRYRIYYYYPITMSVDISTATEQTWEIDSDGMVKCGYMSEEFNGNVDLFGSNIPRIHIFGWKDYENPRKFSGSISFVDIGDLHLTPCQLTRNLFPHEIASSNTALRGECGFADKERYKRGEPWYYGNVAMTGKFGVSDE